MSETTPTGLLAWFDRHFSVRLPFTRFARNMMLLSLLGLVPVLILYIALIPGFWSHLTTSDAALARFVRQILTNGLPVVFTVNAVSLIMFSRSRLRTIGPGFALALDFAARTIAFMVLHAVIFFVSALMFGSFGGDPLQAMRVAGPTLMQAAAFGNLSGVYLYATLISALPLHMALAEIWLERRGYRQASSVALVLFSLAIIAAQVFLLTAIAFAATLPV
jgi:antibiotic biosynthesis monooxygenase (ABM) superfamily enzyme